MGAQLYANGTWSSSVRVNDDDSGESQRRPSLAVDGLGNAYAVWEDYRNGDWDVYYAKLNSGDSAWSANRRLNDDGGSTEQSMARIESDRSGNLQVVWEDGRSGNLDIYRTQLAAGSTVWTANDRINDDGGSGDQVAPDVAYDRDGAAVIVWHDGRNGNNDIYTHRDPFVANVYTYDSLYRLREAGTSSGTTQYQYDPTGNRTVLTDTGTVLTYTYDAADRMVTTGGKSATWDANGNMLTKDGVTYGYDAANRLTTILSGTLVATFEYNADGLRTSATVNGVRTDYLWDVNTSLPVIVTDTNSLYVYGLSLIARQTGASVEYYHTDALGSVRSLTNGSGQNVGAYSYKAFGATRFSTANSQNDRLFTGQQFDSSGLYYLRARYLDPEAGRFITGDTIVPNPLNSQAWNRYVYVLNSPLRYTDPTGHDIFSEETLESYRQIGEGAWDAAVDEVTSIGDLLGAVGRSAMRDEEQWAANRAIARFIVDDPLGAGGLVLEGIAEPYRQAIDCGQYGKAFGRGTVEIVTTVVGFKGITKVGSKLRKAGLFGKAGVGAKDIEKIASYLASIGEDEPNLAMLSRLRAGNRTRQDINFARHELREQEVVKDFMGKDPELSFEDARWTAHEQVLTEQDVSRFDIYHPDVISTYRSQFSDAYRQFHNLK